MLVNVPRLITAYYAEKPDPGVASQKVSFGTSGHRGSSFELSFNENHILAITQAICEYRLQTGVMGAAVSGEGHARALRAGFLHGAGSAGGEPCAGVCR